MDSQLIIAQRAAKIVRACRKNLGISQARLSQELGIDQSALSRVESCRQNLTAQQWFIFCQYVKISPDALSFGLVEIHRVDSSEPSGIRLPSKYSFNARSYVRSLEPLIQAFIAKFGSDQFDHYVDSIGVDPDFFVDMNNRINFNFFLDLSKFLIKKKVIKSDTLDAVTKFANSRDLHGSLQPEYDFAKKQGTFQLCGTLISNVDKYDQNFEFKIIENSPKNILVSMIPQPHMQEFKYLNDIILDDFICRFARDYLEAFLNNSNSVQIEILENMFHDKDSNRCLFSVQI